MSLITLANRVLVEPVKEHMVLGIVLAGAFAYVLGESRVSWLAPEYASHAAKAGATFFGAGICAAILRSKQFLERRNSRTNGKC
jgi:hypothetical protein